MIFKKADYDLFIAKDCLYLFNLQCIKHGNIQNKSLKKETLFLYSISAKEVTEHLYVEKFECTSDNKKQYYIWFLRK